MRAIDELASIMRVTPHSPKQITYRPDEWSQMLMDSLAMLARRLDELEAKHLRDDRPRI